MTPLVHQTNEARNPADGGQRGMLRQVLWMAWSGAVSIANSIVLWAMYARWRPTAELGQFTIVMGLYMIFVTICTLGLGPWLAGEAARRRAQRPETLPELIASALTFLSGWSCVCLTGMSVAGFFASDSSEIRIASVILSLAMLPTSLIAVAEPICTAFGHTRLIALVATVENLLRTIVPLILLYLGCTLSVICASFLGVRLIACLIYGGAARKHLHLWRKANRTTISDIARIAPVFAGVTILAAIHFQAAAVLAGRLGSETVAAEFGAASRFLIPVMILMSSYGSVLQPAASRSALISLSALGEFIARNLRVVLTLALPGTAGTLLLAHELLVVLFGERLAGAAPSLRLLALAIVPLCGVMVISRGLVATGTQRIDLLGNLSAVLVNLVLNVMLIPRYGATGAAAAQVVSTWVLFLAPAVYSSRRLYAIGFPQSVILCAIPLALMAIVVWQVRSLGIWVAVPAGAFIYLAVTLLFRRDISMNFIRQEG